MNWIALAQTIGQLVAMLNQKHAPQIAGATEAATSIIAAIAAHLEAHPDETVTPEVFAMHLAEAKAALLKAGDEAAGRIEARNETEDDGA